MNYMNKSDECKMDIIKAMEKIIDFYDCTDTGFVGLENWRKLVYILTPLKDELFISLSKENKIEMWKEIGFKKKEIVEKLKEIEQLKD